MRCFQLLPFEIVPDSSLRTRPRPHTCGNCGTFLCVHKRHHSLSLTHSLTNFLKAVASCPLTQLLLLDAVSFIRDTVKLRLGRGLQGTVPYKLFSKCCYFDSVSLLAYTACTKTTPPPPVIRPQQLFRLQKLSPLLSDWLTMTASSSCSVRSWASASPTSLPRGRMSKADSRKMEWIMSLLMGNAVLSGEKNFTSLDCCIGLWLLKTRDILRQVQKRHF